MKEEVFALGDPSLLLERLHLSHFRRSFEVGDTVRSCAESDFRNSQDGLENRRRFNEVAREVSSLKNTLVFQKRNIIFLKIPLPAPWSGWRMIKIA